MKMLVVYILKIFDANGSFDDHSKKVPLLAIDTVKPFITTHIYIHATAVWIWSRPFDYTHQLYHR